MKNKFVLLLFFIFVVNSEFLQHKLYYYNSNCVEPYTTATFMKINTCYQNGNQESSYKFNTNSTHIIQTICDTRDCSSKCTEGTQNIKFNSCLPVGSSKNIHFKSLFVF
jgi:hypothetical protein